MKRDRFVSLLPAAFTFTGIVFLVGEVEFRKLVAALLMLLVAEWTRTAK